MKKLKLAAMVFMLVLLSLPCTFDYKERTAMG